MYLFTRTTRLSSPAALQWAADVGALAGEISGQQIDLWGTVYSPGFGTIVWTAWFEQLGALQAMTEALESSDAYAAKAAEGAELIEGGIDDAIAQLISGEPDGSDAFVSSVRAACAGGNIARAMSCGVELAEGATRITGKSTSFLRSVTGAYGGVGWLTGAADLAEFQTTQEALAAEPSWLKTVDATEGAFVEDVAVTQATLYRKLS
jgi:hypothetical protein